MVSDRYMSNRWHSRTSTGANLFMTSNNFGYAHFQPEDASTPLNSMAYVVKQMLAQVDTMKIVKVTGVHSGSGSPPAPGTVDVQPLVNQIDGEGYGVAHGTIYGLPFMRWQAGGWAIVADPVVGDIGLLVCADRDISSVVKNKAKANPGSRRRHSISDGVYLGAILGAAPTSYFQLNSDGTLKIADKQGNVIQTSSNGFALTGNMTVTGNLAVSSSITDTSGAGISLTTHTHGGVTTGGGLSGPPTPGS